MEWFPSQSDFWKLSKYDFHMPLDHLDDIWSNDISCFLITKFFVEIQNIWFHEIFLFSAIAPMEGTSELMVNEDRIYLTRIMPPKLEGQTWILVFR